MAIESAIIDSTEVTKEYVLYSTQNSFHTDASASNLGSSKHCKDAVTMQVNTGAASIERIIIAVTASCCASDASFHNTTVSRSGSS